MKNRYYKKFDLEHARVGAPVGLRNCADATILHFGEAKLIGMHSGVGPEIYAAEWSLDGSHSFPGHEGHLDLVMRPLGMCEGEPVWFGDILRDDKGRAVEFLSRIPDDFDFSTYTRDKPAPKWPVTTLTANELCDMDNAALHGFEGNAYVAFANRIIAHECEAGTVAPAARLKAAEAALFALGFTHVDMAGEEPRWSGPDMVPADKLRPIVRGVLGQYGIDADGYALDAIITSVRGAA